MYAMNSRNNLARSQSVHHSLFMSDTEDREAHKSQDVGCLVGKPGKDEAAAEAVAELQDGLRLRLACDAKAAHRPAHALQRRAFRELLQL